MFRLLLALALVGALVPGVASGSRIATPAEKRAIATGVRLYLRTSGCCALERVGLSQYRVSSLDQDFAKVTIRGTGPSGESGPAATAVLVHTWTGRWVVVALGTARLACGLHPALRKDLALPPCG